MKLWCMHLWLNMPLSSTACSSQAVCRNENRLCFFSFHLSQTGLTIYTHTHYCSGSSFPLCTNVEHFVYLKSLLAEWFPNIKCFPKSGWKLTTEPLPLCSIGMSKFPFAFLTTVLAVHNKVRHNWLKKGQENLIEYIGIGKWAICFLGPVAPLKHMVDMGVHN